MVMMNTDLRAARALLKEIGGGERPVRVLCAVSGGQDSMCLLHLLTTWGRTQGFHTTAAHFNHHLRGAESRRDEEFVREWCAARKIPAVFGDGDVRACAAEKGMSLEEAARELRYAFLLEQKQALGCAVLLTAHHADDNAETMLLNLLRGTGARGLSGIPERRGEILRPFRAVTRAELSAYAEAQQVAYVEDSTNALDDAARNVLRHQVLPVLKELNPRAVENMARAAERLRADEETLNRMAEELLRESAHREGTAVRLDAAPLLRAERAVMDRAIHLALSGMAGRRKDLTARHVDAVGNLLRAREEKSISLPYGLGARRAGETVLIFFRPEAPAAGVIRVGDRTSFGGWTVTLREDGPGQVLHLPENAELRITAWDRNDRMRLPGSCGERSLKRLCVDHGISPAERDCLPVLRVNGRCAAVPGIGIHCAFASGRGRRVYLNFQLEEKQT